MVKTRDLTLIGLVTITSACDTQTDGQTPERQTDMPRR